MMPRPSCSGRQALLCGIFLLVGAGGLEATAEPETTTTISNTFMVLGVTVPGPDAAEGPSVTSFTLNQSKILGDATLPQSANLASQVYASPTLLGDTAPKGGVVTILNSTCLTVTNISVYASDANLAPLVALETWLLLLDGPTLRFSAKREFVAKGTATADRFPAFFFQTTQGGYDGGDANNPEIPPPPPDAPLDWRKKVQIPTWISLDDQLMDPQTHQAWVATNGPPC